VSRRKLGRKSDHSRLASLSGLRVFEACSPNEIRSIARRSTLVGRRAGSVLVREGATGREFLVVVSGSALISRMGVAETVMGPGDWFGDLDLLSTTSSSATVTALTDVDLIVMSRPEFTSVFDAVGPFRSRVVKELAVRARDALDHREPVAMIQSYSA
jgi:CRP-like cAMP-binding protein